MKSRAARWSKERLAKFPDQYRQEADEYFGSMEFCDHMRAVVRKRVKGASARLTKAKIAATGKAMWEDDPQWLLNASWDDLFFQGLSQMHPDCVDGEAPTPRARLTKKQQPKGCASLLLVGAPFLAAVCYFA
jgi:hypothetical protein